VVSSWEAVSCLAHPPHLVLLRLNSENRPYHSKDMLKSIKKRWARVPILGLCCAPLLGTSELIELLETGLDDYVCCPWTERDIVPRVCRALDEEATDGNSASSDGCEGKFRHDALIGQSPCFLQKVRDTILLANSDATVLVTGETGTGKELFAQAIHFNSARRSKSFIPVNCSALPDQLFENELFGHIKGAYTHANSTQLGLVQEAEGGTLFLDEVDTLTIPAQTKLLRFLQNGEYRPLGSPKIQKADVRIIAATNANIRDRIASQEFREDLFYRLNVLTLRVPALRERMEDVPLLAKHFLFRYGRKGGGAQLSLSNEAIDKLMSYSWPGNVRELEGMIQRAFTFASGESIQEENLDLPNQESPQATQTEMSQAKGRAVGEFERSYLINLLARSQGNVSRAAKTAGKERRTFQRLLRKYGLNRETFRAPRCT
jgi:DNA-binding NtrC family response regulator